MKGRLLVIPIGLSLGGCVERPAPPPPASTATVATTSSAETAATGTAPRWIRSYASVPAGTPFPVERFEGFFPPAWKLGDSWRVLLMEVVRSYVPGPGHLTQTSDDYEMRVVAVPDRKGEGDYRLQAMHRAYPRHIYTLTFAARNGCLTQVDEEGREAVPHIDQGRSGARTVTTSRPPVPHVRRPRGSDSLLAPDPLLAFPCLPEDSKNPWVDYRDLRYLEGQQPSDLVWQLVEERGDTLVFQLGTVTYDYFFNSVGSANEVIVEWKRGAPWWSLVKESDKFSPEVFGLDPSMGPEQWSLRRYIELSDGHLIVGRLLGPNEERPTLGRAPPGGGSD